MLFTKPKEVLTAATLLTFPRPDTPAGITTDASDHAVSGVLEQFVDADWRPTAFFSHNLMPAETCSSTLDKELLAIYLTVKHFQYFLEGQTFSPPA